MERTNYQIVKTYVYECPVRCGMKVNVFGMTDQKLRPQRIAWIANII